MLALSVNHRRVLKAKTLLYFQLTLHNKGISLKQCCRGNHSAERPTWFILHLLPFFPAVWPHQRFWENYMWGSCYTQCHLEAQKQHGPHFKSSICTPGNLCPVLAKPWIPSLPGCNGMKLRGKDIGKEAIYKTTRLYVHLYYIYRLVKKWEQNILVHETGTGDWVEYTYSNIIHKLCQQNFLFLFYFIFLSRAYNYAYT